jgi:hypothetical protein
MNGIALRNQMTNNLRLMGIKIMCFCFEFVNVLMSIFPGIGYHFL